ncbi:hypothetical protein NW765_017674 [Fusarium oxysporum]|nr:hypothetical protein NW765_017674 [Fusarium oxysporum]KAJ4248343.1 hypothetical protein NW764_016514 [Fusarium oxysporum]
MSKNSCSEYLCSIPSSPSSASRFRPPPVFPCVSQRESKCCQDTGAKRGKRDSETCRVPSGLGGMAKPTGIFEDAATSFASWLTSGGKPPQRPPVSEERKLYVTQAK